MTGVSMQEDATIAAELDEPPPGPGSSLPRIPKTGL
jgi:hypothetical protein